MNFSADTATTHVGWRQTGSDAADADHLLIRHDWGDAPNPSDDPVLRFLGEEETAAAPAATANPAADIRNTDFHNNLVDAEVDAELDAEVNDAAVDAPPYLWGGEALIPDSVSSPDETVFS